jgi:predicted nucleic acid-binding protein
MNSGDRLVLDSSIALAWCFADEKNDYADAIAAKFPAIEAIVPGLWPLEIGNILVVGERRGRNTQADSVQWTHFLASLPIVIDEETKARAWNETLNLARSHRLSVYDACYLELALRLGLPLATLDAKLKAAAVAAGVPLLSPTIAMAIFRCERFLATVAIQATTALLALGSPVSNHASTRESCRYQGDLLAASAPMP